LKLFTGGDMKYQVGKPGRIIVAKFDDRDDVLKDLTEIVKKENIMAGIFYLLGGMRKGKIVVGPQSEELPPEPVWDELSGSHEILGLGTIFWYNDDPRIHFHGAFGRRDRVKIGCLREKSETFLVLETIIIEIEGVSATRELDPLSGMVLLKL
jgi:predicted DNA-binding protein with PD1-like motif